MCQSWQATIKELHLQYIRNHISQKPIPKSLVAFTGESVRCQDPARGRCTWSGKPQYRCILAGVPEETHPEIRKFFHIGVFSCPCAAFEDCGEWLFFRADDFPRNLISEQQAWEAAGWRRSHSTPKYFLCPDHQNPLHSFRTGRCPQFL